MPAVYALSAFLMTLAGGAFGMDDLSSSFASNKFIKANPRALIAMAKAEIESTYESRSERARRAGGRTLDSWTRLLA